MVKTHTKSITCEVINAKGLHARAAAQIVTTLNQFDTPVTVTHKNNTAPANSLIKLLTLDAPKGSILRFDVEGDECQSVLDVIRVLVASGFNE